jgi:outer membrane murein-binding lipoprotein Lpp
MAAPLDTLQIAKRLEEAGFEEPQAEALTIVLRDLRETDFSNLATQADVEVLKGDVQILKGDVQILKGDVQTLKSDVQTLKGDVQTLKSDVQILKGDVQTLKSDVQILKGDVQALKSDFARVEAKIDLRSAEIKVDIIRWVFGIAFAQAALILTVLKLFPGGHS